MQASTDNTTLHKNPQQKTQTRTDPMPSVKQSGSFREKVLKRKASKRGPISSKLFNLKIVTVKHSKKELIRKSSEACFC